MKLMKGVTFDSICYYYYYYYIVCLMVILMVHGSHAEDYYGRKDGNSGQIANTITGDLNGAGNYKTVQNAINSIPLQNQNWTLILIKNGIYKEKVRIPQDKGFIYMQGGGIEKTIIAYEKEHLLTDATATFTSFSDNIIISGITFKNTYNINLKTSLRRPIKPAVAARMLGDKYVVIDSSFDGFQDTLFDGLGRHYYKNCVITGGIDFIFGYAQSIFEGCTLNVTMGFYEPKNPYGSITAHGRQSLIENGAFVFKDCTVTGNGKALLGRAWKPYARVIYRCQISDSILPIGWDAWEAKGQEYGPYNVYGVWLHWTWSEHVTESAMAQEG
ncbi:unnamed protein product [Thlaspi arvense]|uniref:pectinesterase n=1 Tax=Thlaspi arvense TaxID=13288 RepID=A0AAU9SQ81_THLAR|nr:unnamed protein product [Thlaspi arvense]